MRKNTNPRLCRVLEFGKVAPSVFIEMVLSDMSIRTFSKILKTVSVGNIVEMYHTIRRKILKIGVPQLAAVYDNSCES